MDWETLREEIKDETEETEEADDLVEVRPATADD